MRFEERGDGQQAVEGFERACIGGLLEEGGNEGEQGDRLDGRAGRGVEEIKEELSKERDRLDYAEKFGARGLETNVHVYFS